MASAFKACQDIENESKRLLMPWVLQTFGHKPVEIPSDYESQTRGDWEITDKVGYRWPVELKAEVESTGNLFIETYSNWNSTPVRYGWFMTSRAHELWYVFLDVRMLYRVLLPQLRFWMNGADDDVESGNADRFREVTQAKHSQRNMTKGWIVPIGILAKEVPTWRQDRI